MSASRRTAAATACTSVVLGVLLAPPAAAQPADTSTATIGGPNRTPVVQHDSLVSRGGAPVSVDVFANDSDPDGDALELVGGTSAGHGAVSFDGSTATYVPDAGFVGEDSFSYVASDPYGYTAAGVVRISVTSAAMPDAVQPAAPRRIATVYAPRPVAPEGAAPVPKPVAVVAAPAPQRRVGPPTTPHVASVAARPAARPATLPFTGVPTHVLVPLGLGLLVAGGLTTLVGRRRSA